MLIDLFLARIVTKVSNSVFPRWIDGRKARMLVSKKLVYIATKRPGYSSSKHGAKLRNRIFPVSGRRGESTRLIVILRT